MSASKRALVFFAEGFEELEALAPVDILRRVGIETDIVAVAADKTVKSARNIGIVADKTISDINAADYDACILPGGSPGFKNLKKSESVKSIVLDMYNSGKLVAAICAAPTVLASYGILDGRKACCFPGMEDELSGAIVSYEKVVRDSNIITSRGAGTAIDFALAITAYLGSEQMASDIAKTIVYA